MLMRFIVLFLIALLCSSCSSFKKYYYPYEKFESPVIYKYECLEDPSRTGFWKMTYDSEKEIFTTEAYDHQFQYFEYFAESIENDGTILIEFAEINNDIKPPTSSPYENDVYKWNDKTSYQYAVKYISSHGIMTLTKSRKYAGFENMETKQGKFKCLKFDEHYTMRLDSEKEDYQFSQFSYYSKNRGMIAYQRTLPDGRILNYELSEILNQADWNTLTNSGN